MQKNMQPQRATLLPPDLAQALQDVRLWPEAQRQARMDDLTDEAARKGYCRPRHDLSRYDEWRQKRGGFEVLPA